MVSLSSSSSFNLPSHDHSNRGGLLSGEKAEQETVQTESAATRGKMDGRLSRSQPTLSGLSSDRCNTPPSALESYFALLFQETFPKAGGNLKISFDNAKAKRDYRSKGRRRKKNTRIELSLSSSSDEAPFPPTTPVNPPVVSKRISRWETGSPASTVRTRKTSAGSAAVECAVSNASMPTSTMPRQPIRSLTSESNDHRIPPGGLFVGDLMMCDSNEKKERGLRMGRKEKMLADDTMIIKQESRNIAFEQPPSAPLDRPLYNAAA